MFDDAIFPYDSIKINCIYIQIGNTLESHLRKGHHFPLKTWNPCTDLLLSFQYDVKYIFKIYSIASKCFFNPQGLVLAFKLIYPWYKKTFCLLPQIIDSRFKILNTMLCTLKCKTAGELTHVLHAQQIPFSASAERPRGSSEKNNPSLCPSASTGGRWSSLSLQKTLLCVPEQL